MSEQDEERQSETGLLPGTVVAGRFQVQRKLGEGGMGAVYAAVNIATNRSVALKVMHPEYAAKKDIVKRFMREAKAATVITHPNVIEVLDVVNADGGEPVMVMELLSGEPLDALVDARGALPLAEAARIMTAVVSAVGAAHARGIVHRDLKPENIFLARGADGAVRPKVLDFGIAKILDPSQINEGETKTGATKTGSMLGTPHYMSVEQACGEKDIDHRTDIWSIGIILYVMLSGRRPYEGENYGQILKALMTETPTPLGSLVPGLPREVCDIVERCMARQKDHRPYDLREVYAILARFCDATNVAPPSMSQAALREVSTSATLAAASVYTSAVLPTTTGPARSRKMWAWAAIPVLAVVIVGAGVLGLRKSAPVPQALADPGVSASSVVAGGTPTAVISAVEPAPTVAASSAVSAPSTPLVVGPGKGKPAAGAGTKGAPAETTAPAPTKQPGKQSGGGIIESSPY